MRFPLAGLIAITVLALSGPAAAAPDRVRIDSGSLVGDQADGVRVFKGIPFAKPPVGALRWTAPQTPATWGGDRDATKFQLPCPQVINANGTANGGGVSGEVSEDCLYLNVYAPANARNAPVMLWLYGGAGTLGGAHLGAYNGTSFAKQGVIIVTVNYRLGALGSFAHPALTKARKAGEPMSNYALMDAIAGLQWVQRNIATFGGDKNNVTLFGQSAGGAMVSSLLSSPAAKGLFHKAIVHSGASITSGTELAASEAAGIQTATAVGLPGADATLEQLRAVPAGAFIGKPGVVGMRGVLDGTIKTGTTRAALENGTAIDVPLIVGSNNGEGGADTANALVNLAASGAPAYQYYFTYVPEWRRAAQPRGAPHSAEIPYAWASLGTSATGGGAQVTDKDRTVAARINSCWVAFAKAPPTARSLTCAEGFVWPARTPQNEAVAMFGEVATVGKMSTVLAAAAAAAAPAAARGGTTAAGRSSPSTN